MKNIMIVLMALLCSLPALLYAQVPIRTNTGAIKVTPEEYRKLEIVKMVRSFTTISGKPFEGLPRAVDLSAGFPAVGNQGNSLSCYAWATTYAIKSFQEQREIGWAFGKNHIFSPAFMHNQFPKLAESDHYLNMLKFVVEQGAVPLSFMPFFETDESTQPTPEMKRLGLAFRALAFRRLDVNDLHTLKAMLASGEPVGLDMWCHKSFFALNKQHPILKSIKGEEVISGHHLVAVGYDDAKHAIKVMNSWGPAWGENGFGWIDYDLIKDVVQGAWVLYDRPTPQAIVEYLKDANSKPAGPVPAFSLDASEAAIPYKSDATGVGKLPEIASKLPQPAVMSEPTPGDWQKAPQGEPIYIVPEEAGITTNKAWVRLGEPLTRTKQFFTASVSPRLAGFKDQGDDVFVSAGVMGEDQIGRMDFLAANRLPIMTKEGIGFGAPKARVRRAYGKPDATSPLQDTFFYQSAASNWGGIKVISTAALEFTYDDQGRVQRMALLSTYKPAYTGNALKPISEKEYQTQGLENLVTSPEGHLSFVVPAGFQKVEKAIWPGIGVGYFIRENTVNSMLTLTIKVFDMPNATQETLLTERIPADLVTQRATDHKPFQTIPIKGVNWILAEDPTGAMQRYYALHNGRVYQVYVFSDVPVTGEAWIRTFLQSLEFKP